MRRLDRIISNRVIHDQNKNWMLQGRNLVYSTSQNLNTSQNGLENTRDLVALSYSQHKENEALSGYLTNDRYALNFPDLLKSFFRNAIESNEDKLSEYHRKARLNMKYDNKVPISSFCEFAYVSAKTNTLTSEFLEQHLRAGISEKQEFASRQNLIDLLVTLVHLEVAPQDPLYERAVKLLEAKLSVRYENVRLAGGFADQYESSSETVDERSNAPYNQFAEGFGPNGGFKHTGRYKFLLNFLWTPYNFVVGGRLFRRTWNFHHVFDKPSDQAEIANLKELLRNTPKPLTHENLLPLLERL